MLELLVVLGVVLSLAGTTGAAAQVVKQEAKEAAVVHFSAPFRTPELAAHDALTRIAAYSFETHRELGGRVYFSNKWFYYTKPTIAPEGLGSSLDPGTVPPGTLDAGFYHTHPNVTSDGLSPGDQARVAWTFSRVYLLSKPTQGQLLPSGNYGRRMYVWQVGTEFRKLPAHFVEWKPWGAGDSIPEHYARAEDRGPENPVNANPLSGIYLPDGKLKKDIGEALAW